MNKFVAILLFVALCSCFGIAKGRGGSHHHSSKAVTVRAYTKKDGTHVDAHTRSVQGRADHTATSSPLRSSTSHHVAFKQNHVAEGYTAHASVQHDRHGKIKRSGAAKDAFKKEQPCPSTGKSSGRCPGYVIDHRKPLECGGADAPTNMQWQTVSAGKAKDKSERYCR